MKNNTLLINSIVIENLFEIFNYKIKYPDDERVLIITGPNGFGKTQVLNIIFNLFNHKFLYFRKLVFEKISIKLNNEIEIRILKNKNKDLQFIFSENGEDFEIFNYSTELTENLLRTIDRYLPVHRIDEDEWIDHRNSKVISFDELIYEYADHLPGEISKDVLRINNERAIEILDSINVHLIREQRLFKKIQNPERNFRNERDQTIMIETIQTYAIELRKLILEKSQQSFIISQNLDSTYPNRLITENKKVSKSEYDERFASLTEKQEKLTKNGLYESKQKVLSYSADDAKALLVYLNDLEKKLSVFDDLLEKLELFINFTLA